MAAITLGPIASGLPKDIVDRLVEAQSRPLLMLKDRKKNEEARLQLVNELNTKLSQINTDFEQLARLKRFRELGSSVGRPDLMDVSVDKEIADPGEYQIKVKQLAGRSSMISNGFEDPNETQIGVGYFSYDLPSGETREVYISEEDNTLESMAKKLNAQKDLNLNALVVNDGTGSDAPWRLIISQKNSGEINDAEFPDFYFVDGDNDFYVEEERPAQNSVLEVNGFPVEFEGTKIDTLFPGVTIDLKDADPNKEFTLKIFEDRNKIQEKISAIIKKTNEVLQFIQQQNSLDENSNTANTLGGDVTIQNIESLIRTNIITPIQTNYGDISFNDMGVTFQRNGLLETNENKLQAYLQNKFEAASEYFTGPNDNGQGFVGKMSNSVKSYIRQGGIVKSRSDGIRQRIKDIDKQIESAEKNLEQIRKDLQAKFANLESSMARLKSQQQQVQGTLGGSNLLDGMKLG